MIENSHQPELQAPRWKALRFGLRLASSNLGAGLIAGFYALWALFGLILCLVFIPIAIMGKEDVFKHGLKPIALYGFAVPMAVLAAATWGVKFFSRLLWCAIPEPLMATLFALASVSGRLCVVIGVVYLWLRGGPWGKGLLLPGVVACAGMAWLGLAAEWGFMRTLQREFIPTVNPAQSPREMDKGVVNSPEDERITEQDKQSVLRRDFGEWFKRRFPKGYKLLVWILFPLGYVTVSSLADNGDLRAVPESILRLAVIAPVILETFWIPSYKLHSLIDAFSHTHREIGGRKAGPI